MRLAAPSPARFAVVALLAVGAAMPALAQRGGNGYLFGQPEVSLTIRGGYARANAGSDLFDQVTQDLTLSKGDFSGITVGAELGFALTSRLNISVDLGYSRSNKRSEFRKFIDNENLPIEQNTEFERLPLMVNLKAYLMPRGRSIGKLAWIPAPVAPWVGVGGGTMRYRFHQYGDFIDFNTKNVFRGDYNTDDWTTAFQGLAGADISLSPHIALTGEARYLWAKAPLGRDFSGFERIDLSGVSATLGLTYRM
jgi:opacity protein-like surface antigen